MIYDNDLHIKQMEENLLLAGRSPNTINTYTHAVFQLSLFAKKPSHLLTVDDARNYIIHLHQENRLAKNTINCYNSCIRYFFESILDISISKHKVPFYSVRNKPITILSDSQLKTFFSAISFNSRLIALYTLTYTCGLRISEAQNLMVTDINISDMTVHIAPSKRGKERILHLCHDAHMALRQYSKENHLKKDHFLFAVKDGGRPASETLRNHLKQHLQLANLDHSFSFHIFRHTIATNLLVNGTDAFSLMTFLGHNTLGATSRYVHLAQLKKATYASSLEAVMGGFHHD